VAALWRRCGGAVAALWRRCGGAVAALSQRRRSAVSLLSCGARAPELDFGGEVEAPVQKGQVAQLVGFGDGGGRGSGAEGVGAWRRLEFSEKNICFD
jgi:hypothetical protein